MLILKGVNNLSLYGYFHRRQHVLISKFNVGLKTPLREDLSEAEFYGDLVCKFMKLKGRNNFSFQFTKKALYVTDVQDIT